MVNFTCFKTASQGHVKNVWYNLYNNCFNILWEYVKSLKWI